MDPYGFCQAGSVALPGQHFIVHLHAALAAVGDLLNFSGWRHTDCGIAAIIDSHTLGKPSGRAVELGNLRNVSLRDGYSPFHSQRTV